MITIFAHRDGKTEKATRLERGWLTPSSGVYVWVDLAAPSIPESLVLSDSFAFHPLSVEDAMSAQQYPKAEAYDGYLYVVLHGIDFRALEHGFATHDIDFFVGPNYLVTVHDGYSRSVAEVRDHCDRNHQILGDGPVALFHRIVDAMVDRYRPEIDKLEDRIDELEKAIFDDPAPEQVREILAQKRDVSLLRRITTPQRDVVARLARRDFVDISTEMSFRFRDVQDQLVRIADDASMFQDRITGILDAHLSNVSNRLNAVMKVLAIVATIFMPLTLIAGLWGMNVRLPQFTGGEMGQFWWVIGLSAAVAIAMLAMFRRMRWM